MRFNRVFLCLLCCMLVCNGCDKAFAANTEAAQEVNEGEKEACFLDTLTFLGDSTTAHMLLRAPLKDGKESKQVWATKSRYLNLSSRITYEKIICPENGQELTIAEVAAITRPVRLVITLGIDYGVYYYRNDLETFGYYYEKLLDAILSASPNTNLILQSIFPVGKSSTVITNAMVDNANGVIAEIAARRSLVYIDTATVLKDAEGYLKADYCYSDDGIHLTAAGYEAIFKNIKKYETEVKAKE